MAAAHGADGLQTILGAIAAGQVPSVDNVGPARAELRRAQESFQAAIANIGIRLSMLEGLDALFDD